MTSKIVIQALVIAFLVNHANAQKWSDNSSDVSNNLHEFNISVFHSYSIL